MRRLAVMLVADIATSSALSTDRETTAAGRAERAHAG